MTVSTKKSTYVNPIVEQRADPWVYKHTDGYYYFTGSLPTYDGIELRRAKTLNGLKEAEPVIVWNKPEIGPASNLIWAPEIHFIDGNWYIYFAAEGRNEAKEKTSSHRMFVLENKSKNPLDLTWVEKGQLKTNWESFSLDATTFEHKGKRYLVWPQKDEEIAGNSNLYIAEMENAWTIKGQQTLLTKPEYDWETIGFAVNEGPAVVIRNQKVFIAYSASATDHHYCMGLLTADENANLLDSKSWIKSNDPVFVTNEDNSKFGPGHNSFTVSEDGKEDVLIYHARSYKEIVGDPLYDPNRHACAQVFTWDKGGDPFFGVPVADSKK
ncbi:family 43 glycosylhydrolase [Salipaludibacillus sp. HK11]|uniref:glycoside hydrolase family 43 protein n=1 Tax=Salipaludibacillus sp. HK11 TaxID=3394320 RepID=UPI0039FDB8DC